MILEKKLRDFRLDGKSYGLDYMGPMQVAEGVDCETYAVLGSDHEKLDLARIFVDPDHSTPHQRVISGSRTIERYTEGEGRLVVKTEGHPDKTYEFPQGDAQEDVVVEVGQTMQWFAGKTGLVFLEICEPPYEDGRYENLPE